MTSAPPPVVVVGAGVAGLAAAVRIADAGRPVLLLERRARGGGRAASYHDSPSDEILDNGQHLLIAGYERTMAFLETVGARHLVTVQPKASYLFHHPSRGFLRFELPRLPAPLHLAAGMLASPLLPLRDRLRFLAAGGGMLRRDAKGEGPITGMTVDQWLRSAGQSAEARLAFWEPLAVAIMNERTTTAAALPFVRALREALLQRSDGAAAVLPRVGLTELFADPSLRFIASRGGIVRCAAAAGRVSVDEGGVAGVTLASGEEVQSRNVILAVPPHALPPLLPGPLAAAAGVADTTRFRWSPILSIHLWYAADFMPHTLLGVLGRTVQWAFNRRRIAAAAGAGGHVSVTMSAAHELVDRGNDELARTAARDLASIYGAEAGSPLRAVVIRERRATYSSTPEAERLRPPQRSPVRGLLFAGDWTATGLPATIEGAIRSGETCADIVLAGTASAPGRVH
jgi:zeta-carotene desaturase